MSAPKWSRRQEVHPVKVETVSKILIVDDNADFLELAAQQVASENHQVDTCRGAAGVPAMVTAGNYEMLLIDMHIAGLNVGDLLTLLRMLPTFRQTRVILLSDQDEDDMRTTAKKFECEFMVKSTDRLSLLNLVRRSFASKPPGLPA